jgi:hypothetical protein
MNRLEKWENRVEAGGGQWKIINDLEQLDKLIQY